MRFTLPTLALGILLPLTAVAGDGTTAIGGGLGGALGGAIGSTLEGNRSLFVEVQALVGGSAFGTPQRSTTGFDQRRLSMLIAVMEKRCGYRLNQMDVFLNIAGGLRVDRVQRRAWLAEEEISLTPRVFDLLWHFASHPGHVFSRAQLLDLAYDDTLDVNERAVDSHIKNLRRKLAQVDAECDPIRAVYGVGFRLDL